MEINNNFSWLRNIYNTLYLDQTYLTHTPSIFLDSKLIVSWENQAATCTNIYLQPLLEKVKGIQHILHNISFGHTYREYNLQAETLAK